MTTGHFKHSDITLTPDMMPKVLSDFVFQIAEDQQTPPDFAAVTCLVSIASILGNSVKIYGKRNGQWFVHCTLWGALIGEPTTGKSIAMNKGLEPFKELEKFLIAKWREKFGDQHFWAYARRVKQADQRRKIDNLIRNGQTDIAKRMYDDLSAISETPPRLTVHDITMESLAETLKNNPRGLLMIQPELSGFISELSHKDNKTDRCFYMHAYDGTSDFVCDRIGRGHLYLPKVTISLLGTIQPTEIAHLVRAAANNQTNDGFLQRIQLAVFPDPVPNYKWVDSSPDFNKQNTYAEMLHHIYQYAQNFTATRLDDDAQHLFAAWVTEMKSSLSICKTTTIFKSHKLKMIDTVLKLSFVFHACDVLSRHYTENIGRVSVDALGYALRWSTYLLAHAEKMYDLAKND